MKLNLGCGEVKLEGWVNVDVDATVEPDECYNFVTSLPYEDESVETVALFHVIEHIPKNVHRVVLQHIRRVLKPAGILYVSFPEFSKVATNWLDNKWGKRQFWEQTIYGRQSSPSDFHVCCMDSEEFVYTLKQNGFRLFNISPEPLETYNTVIKAIPDILQSYEEEVLNEVWTKRPFVPTS